MPRVYSNFTIEPFNLFTLSSSGISNTSKDLVSFTGTVPGNVQVIGPIDTNEAFIRPITEDYTNFLKNNDRLMIVAFGTHLMLNGEQINKLLVTILSVLDEGIVDGIIWTLNLDTLGYKTKNQLTNT